MEANAIKFTTGAAALEALLFAYGETISFKAAGELLGMDGAAVRSAYEILAASYRDGDRGITTIVHDGNIQLVTKPAYAPLIETLFRETIKEALTPAALETLTIITYAGGIQRSGIDYIRGVNSSFSIRSLLMRGLIERTTDPARGNAYRYGPSADLLRFLGIANVEALPDYPALRARIDDIQKAST
jgi:segregation and condensation protein B